ncbi:uncharacterized protein BDZ99DRAFT_93791 [Mytilinidion resinicola]|uniref:Uncharacterized protein n=1 Tax=Mytilinidion resinicola TaxID=574789 RepID=A0A6A6YC08_9PEZI|nr:uncharacterized protein BDZ99DRAFT_93791 [Mytilinidion resinicola]KAF2806342.1 hypothetical protein BDZ99DRAFT_93791 [Mytilinidion resinicola]
MAFWREPASNRRSRTAGPNASGLSVANDDRAQLVPMDFYSAKRNSFFSPRLSRFYSCVLRSRSPDLHRPVIFWYLLSLFQLGTVLRAGYLKSLIFGEGVACRALTKRWSVDIRHRLFFWFLSSFLWLAVVAAYSLHEILLSWSHLTLPS